MATQVFGSIAPFNMDSDDVTEWVERLEQWFEANEITVVERKRALLLSNIGARGYKLLRSLSQNNPTSKTYEQLKKLLLDHINPTPNEISQRFVFYRRDRRAGETVKDYIAELRRLSEHCKFDEKLEENLRDKFVCGLNDGVVQQKLLATKNLTLSGAIDTAVAVEAAVKSAKQIHGVGLEGQVHKLGEGSNRTGGSNKFQKKDNVRECYRCGNLKHLADKCPFKFKECFGCKKIGHSIKKCRKANPVSRNSNSSNIHLMEETENAVELEDDDLSLSEEVYCLNLYRLEVEGQDGDFFV